MEILKVVNSISTKHGVLNYVRSYYEMEITVNNRSCDVLVEPDVLGSGYNLDTVMDAILSSSKILFEHACDELLDYFNDEWAMHEDSDIDASGALTSVGQSFTREKFVDECQFKLIYIGVDKVNLEVQLTEHVSLDIKLDSKGEYMDSDIRG